MAFQDFDIIQERRRQERRRVLKKRLTIGFVALFILGGIAAAAAVACTSTKNNTNNSNKKEHKGDNKSNNHPPPSATPPPSPKTPSPPPPAESQGLVATVCEGSTYTSICEETVTKTIAQNPKSATEPKELAKSFITSTTEELNKAFAKASTIPLKTPVEKKAFEVCKEVVENAKEELRTSFDGVGTVVPGKPQTDGDLNNWLSAVMAYQETCVDSFPEGPSKVQFRTTLNSSELYTSNSLAVVSRLAGLTNLPPVKPGSNLTQLKPVPNLPNVNPAPNLPQAKPAANVSQPQAKPAANVSQPQAKPAANASQPHAKPAANVSQPQAKPAANASQPHAKPAANLPQPRAKLAANLPQPHAKPAVKLPQPQAKPAANLPQPLAKPAVKIPQPQVKPAANLPQPQVKPATKRRLLQDRYPLLAKDGLPRWMSHEERRLLKKVEDGAMPAPNAIVAQDGTGKFKTINLALAAIPPKHQGRYVIFVKKGIYAETVIIAKRMVNLTIYGEGSQKTIITGAKSFGDGIPTYHTATFVAAAPGFIARSIGFRNTAGPDKHQAVAARVSADKSIFTDCHFEGFQDTLYAHTHRQFYRNCVIVGTIDFIFGDAAAVFQECTLYVRKPGAKQKNIVTAQGRKDKFETTGIVIQNCKILPEETFKPFTKEFKSYLGRPWKQYSRTIIMGTLIEGFIDPAGWLEWEGDFALNTLFYGEFNNTGPGAKTQARVKWAGRKDMNKEEAAAYTVETFLNGAWMKEAGAPVGKGPGS